MLPTLLKLGEVLLCGALVLNSSRFQFALAGDSQWLASTTWWYRYCARFLVFGCSLSLCSLSNGWFVRVVVVVYCRLAFLMLAGIFVRARYYFGWKLAEVP